MLNIGTKIETPGMLLKVKDMRGTWVKCEYWDAYNKEWKERGCTENKKRLEQKLVAGDYRIVK